MTGAPAHVAAALEAQRALAGEDLRGAVAPRRHMANHVVGASAHYPDAVLWASFQSLARAWANAVEPVVRLRYGDALAALAEAIIKLDVEDRSAARLKAAERQRAMAGQPAGDV